MTFIQLFLIILLIAIVVFLIYFILRFFISPARADGIKSLLKQGKVTQAIKLAKRLLNVNPEDYHAHYYLGKAYVADNRPELALMEYKIVNKKAIFDISLPEIDFREEIADLYEMFKHDKEALQEYILLSKLEPKNSDIFFKAGAIFEKSNKTEQALNYYEKAIALNKKNAKAHSAKGRILYKIKQFPDAKKELDKANSLSSNIFVNYYYLGKILKEAKDYVAAVNAFEKSLRDPAYKQRSFIERGSCFMAVNQEDKALFEFKKAIDSSKNEASQQTLYARYFLASIYEQQHQIEKALTQWKKIYTQNHNFHDVATKLATYHDLQQNDNMKEYLSTNNENFLVLCKQIAEKAMNFSVKQATSTSFGCKILVSEAEQDNWMNMRQQLIQILFYRDTELIKDNLPRQLLDDLKKTNCIKGIICTSSGFTRTAKDFSESRPIELIDRTQLEKILENFSLG